MLGELAFYDLAKDIHDAELPPGSMQSRHSESHWQQAQEREKFHQKMRFFWISWMVSLPSSEALFFLEIYEDFSSPNYWQITSTSLQDTQTTMDGERWKLRWVIFLSREDGCIWHFRFPILANIEHGKNCISEVIEFSSCEDETFLSRLSSHLGCHLQHSSGELLPTPPLPNIMVSHG